jgi:hypothetical protein
VEALRQGLRDLGYIEGKNIVIEFRWADGVDQLPELAAEFVRMHVDIIFAASSTMVEPARQATKTIPIVFATHGDPVGLGHVASLARPGGNITGLSMLLTDLAAKELEILTQAVPQATRIGVLWNPTTPLHQLALKAVETAGEKLGVQLVMVPARSANDFERAFSTMSREGVTGLLRRVVAAHRLPAGTLSRAGTELPAAGGVRDQDRGRGGRSHELRRGYHRSVSPCSSLHRQNPQRRQTSRPARGAGVQISAGHQPEDRQGARIDDPADALGSRRRGDRMMKFICCAA